MWRVSTGKTYRPIKSAYQPLPTRTGNLARLAHYGNFFALQTVSAAIWHKTEMRQAVWLVSAAQLGQHTTIRITRTLKVAPCKNGRKYNRSPVWVPF